MSRKPQSCKLNRRELLIYAWLGAFAIMMWQFFWLFVRIANPHGLESMLGGPILFGSVADRPTAGAAPVDDPVNRIWLVNTPEGLLALDKTCTHLDCLLAWDAQMGEYFCPCHGSRFAQDGTHVDGPAPRDMDRYVVQVTDGQDNVLLMTDTSSGAPLSIDSSGLIASGQANDDTANDDTAEEAASVDAKVTIWVDKSQKIQGAPVI